MESPKSSLRFSGAKLESSSRHNDDWRAIRRLQDGIIKTSERIKHLSLKDGTLEETVKREAEDSLARECKDHRGVFDEEIAGLERRHLASRSPKADKQAHHSLRTVLGRLKNLPAMYAEFKRRGLSVREILGNASAGLTSLVLVQVLEFLDQLMDVEEHRYHLASRATQTPSYLSVNSTQAAASRLTASPLMRSQLNHRETPDYQLRSALSADGRPMLGERSPARSYTSNITPPREAEGVVFKGHWSAVQHSEEAYESSREVHSSSSISLINTRGWVRSSLQAAEDRSPQEPASPGALEKYKVSSSLSSLSQAKDSLDITDESRQMLASIQVQSERIANMNELISQTMARSMQLLAQPLLRASPFTETTSPSEAFEVREGNLHLSQVISELSEEAGAEGSYS
jgi:hypothetical protein